ncbi:MAG TPA: CcmD family protein [Caldithrix abyssi]|uniref:CcmD family protein n=1 Tax=Caldithrix abyssi TaxID=187145 RepID=A0A7V1LJM4_CALAY|nr:CcmD family protein [Caldithrix abyssi]
MSDVFVVAAINMIVWLGIFGYMVSLNIKLNKLEKEIEEKE